MAKKKNSASLIVKIVLLVLAALMVVSIFTDLVTIKYDKDDNIIGSIVSGVSQGEDSHITGQDTFETMFEGHDELKNKESGKNLLKTIATSNEDEHKFVVVMLEICFVVAVIAGIACLVLSLLSMLGINLGIIHKIVALVFMVASVLTFIFALIVGNVWQKELNSSAEICNGMAGVGAWFALICGAGYGVTYLATCNRK